MKQWRLNKSPLAGQINIAHSLPGRLRLSVPGLFRLRNGYDFYVQMAEKLLISLPGIRDASINPLTANVLLHYEATTVSESDILDWIERLSLVAVHEYKKMDSHTPVHVKILRLATPLNDEIRTIRNNYADA